MHLVAADPNTILGPPGGGYGNARMRAKATAKKKRRLEYKHHCFVHSMRAAAGSNFEPTGLSYAATLATQCSVLRTRTKRIKKRTRREQ